MAMADNIADGGYESFPFHNTIEVEGRNRGKFCALFYLSCIVYFFYHRFFGTDWKAANALEFVALFCELFFAYLWVQNQIMTWFFTVRYTDPERLCRRRFNIEPRAPIVYFNSRPNVLSQSESESSVSWFNIGEWEELEQEYKKVKLDISRARESCGQVLTEVQEMFDQLSRNQTIEIHNHPGLIKSFDQWVDHLPRLIYVSRKKRPGWKHHYKAGALNSLARVSGIITNSPFILNLHCDMYVNNSKALVHAMCFRLDPHIQEEDCLSFVQFPQHFSGIDKHDIYDTKMTFTFDVLIRGLDGWEFFW